MKNIKIRITLLEDMLGTVPKDKKIYETYISTKKKEIDGKDLTASELIEEVETIEEVEQRGWTGFHSDENGLFIFDYMIRGFLKNAGNILKKEEGVNIKQLASKISQSVFVFPRKIHLNKNEPDGVCERPLRCSTAQGPRVSLARSDVVNAGTSFECEIKIVSSGEIGENTIKKLLDYGQFQGLGQFRSGSYGRFSYEIL